MFKFQVCRDETTVSKHETEAEARKALKALKLGQFEQGYLDEIDENGEPVVTIAEKMKTNGGIIENQ